jgi:DNA-binding winged helix-turn-helix (wHTH) protein
LLRFEGFTIDLQRRGLYRGVERIHLTPIPFNVLTFLVKKRGFVVSKQELLDAIWGGRRDGNTVEQTIRQIRLALSDEKEQPRFIRTIPGVGYSFVAEIEGGNVAELEEKSALGTREAIPSGPSSRSRFFWVTVLITVASVLVVSSLLLGYLILRQTAPGLTVANPVRLTRSQTHILSPLLGDGARIYFPRYENGKYSVATVPVGGGESAVVVTGISNPELCDLAPDGGSLLLRDLVHSRDELEPLYIQPRTGPLQKLGDILAYDAAWYPNAKRIIYSADGVVYTTDIGGKSPKQLFSVPGNPFWFRWSPDGKRLRFTVIDKTNESTSIWEVGADGKEPHRLFPDLHYHLCCGSWTPDGEYFVFQVRVENAFQIWAQRDRQGFLLSFRNQPFPLISGALNYRGPLASKDGKNLYVRAEAPRGEIARYDSKVDEFIPVLPSISARTLAYSQDKMWIAYTSLAVSRGWYRMPPAHTEFQEHCDAALVPRWSDDRIHGARIHRQLGCLLCPWNWWNKPPSVQRRSSEGLPRLVA